MLRDGNDLVALKMVTLVEIMARTIRLQLKFTNLSSSFATLTLVLTFKSLTCSFSVISSCFSRTCSSRNVGLNGFIILPGVPGTLNALFNGEDGVSGISTGTPWDCLWLSDM